MKYDGYRSKWQDDDSTVYPLKLSRKKVLIELEVDATVTDYNSHQIMLTHPSMDGALIFDVEDLEQAEDSLDELQMEVEAQFELDEGQNSKPPPKQSEPVKVNPFPQSQFYSAQPRPDPKPQPKPEPPKPEPKPEPKTVNIPPHTPQPNPSQTQHVRKSDYDAEANPVLSIMTDISEICDLMTKISPRIFKKK